VNVDIRRLALDVERARERWSKLKLDNSRLFERLYPVAKFLPRARTSAIQSTAMVRLHTRRTNACAAAECLSVKNAPTLTFHDDARCALAAFSLK